jgi:hypothetical protein
MSGRPFVITALDCVSLMLGALFGSTQSSSVSMGANDFTSDRGDARATGADEPLMKGDDIATRLEAFAAEVITIVRALPKDRPGKLMADQVLRSSCEPNRPSETVSRGSSKKEHSSWPS